MRVEDVVVLQNMTGISAVFLLTAMHFPHVETHLSMFCSSTSKSSLRDHQMFNFSQIKNIQSKSKFVLSLRKSCKNSQEAFSHQPWRQTPSKTNSSTATLHPLPMLLKMKYSLLYLTITQILTASVKNMISRRNWSPFSIDSSSSLSSNSSPKRTCTPPKTSCKQNTISSNRQT